MASVLEQSKALLVRRWGEMGGYWGISRTMAEIHALLFVSGGPLCTDDVMRQLHVSRGNASMNLRALVDWGLIERVHQLGDRKEYFQADTNVWHMFETIMRERRRREVEPIIATIDRCRQMVEGARGDDTVAVEQTGDYRRRLGELQDFLTTMSALFELVLQMGGERVAGVAQVLTAASGAAGTQKTAPVPAPAKRKRKR
jgi:HTH-type transcriptional regulator, glycine betaine synthesis regulator